MSILYLGGGIGAALGGSICDSFGRRKAILITDVLFLIGAVVLYSSPTFEFVVVGRIIVGFAVAVSGIADVSYLHEIAPVQHRGSIVSVNEACISLGFLLAFAVASLLSYEGSDNSGWRIMFGVSGIVALLQFVGMWDMPESPVWLKERGRHEEYESALRQIQSRESLEHSRKNVMTTKPNTSTYDALRESSSLYESDGEIERSTTSSASETSVTSWNMAGRSTRYLRNVWFLVLQLQVFLSTTTTRYRRQAWIALFLSVAQQLCGHTNVLSYAPIILETISRKDDGLSSFLLRWSNLLIGLVKFAVTVVVIWKVESFGRRRTLLTGVATLAAGLLLMSIAFRNTPVEGDEQGTIEHTGRGFRLALPGILLVVSGYSMSFGPLTWLLISELFPTEIRGRALGLSTIVTYIFAALTTVTFLTAQDLFGQSAVFGAFFAITASSFVFAYTAIPDTGGLDPWQLDEVIDTMLWWRKCGQIDNKSHLLEPETELS